MKRTLIAAAAVLAAGTAFAQSSVQLYGRVNTSIERQTTETAAGAKTNTNVMQDNNSRWGLRGVEDLGSGLKALFVLESGFSADTGAGAGRLFGRESWVGVEGNFGRFRLGNMGQTAAYYTTADYISMHNHDTGTSEDKFYLGTGRKQNMISYNTPSFGGLVVEAQYSLKQNTDNTEIRTGQDTALVAANFDRGPLHLGATYVDGPVTMPGVGTSSLDGKELGLRALYEVGPVTLGAYYIRNEAELGTAEYKRNSYRVSGMYTLGASEFHLNVGYADNIKGLAGDTDALQYTVAYNYNLSKRTKVYAFYTKVDNKGTASYFTGVAGSDAQSIALGVRHNF